tara:strand:+ start:675 stop:1373 length:699 start_codon:yes stop_codon:yes gene_type:complete
MKINYFNYRYILPGFYTTSRRLKTAKALLLYIYHNMLFPSMLALLVGDTEIISTKFFLWLFIIHLTYEIGYFMNDYFASDSSNNWRNPDYLTKKEKNYYLIVKLLILFLFLLFIKEWSINLIATSLLIIYILHNSLKKQYRFFSFIFLRVLKMLPFFILPKISLVLFFYFLGHAILEGIVSYFDTKTIKLPFWFLKVPLALLFLPSITNFFLVLLIQFAPKIYKNGFRLFGN